MPGRTRCGQRRSMRGGRPRLRSLWQTKSPREDDRASLRAIGGGPGRPLESSPAEGRHRRIESDFGAGCRSTLRRKSAVRRCMTPKDRSSCEVTKWRERNAARAAGLFHSSGRASMNASGIGVGASWARCRATCCAVASSFSNEIKNASVTPRRAFSGTWPRRAPDRRSSSVVTLGGRFAGFSRSSRSDGEIAPNARDRFRRSSAMGRSPTESAMRSQSDQGRAGDSRTSSVRRRIAASRPSVPTGIVLTLSSQVFWREVARTVIAPDAGQKSAIGCGFAPGGASGMLSIT